jgi:catechol 2,3-dioxygenase-like lactoylglutathione lyase family enzyme
MRPHTLGLVLPELVTIVVDDYDTAIPFFVDTLGFDLVEDTPSKTITPTAGWCRRA